MSVQDLRYSKFEPLAGAWDEKFLLRHPADIQGVLRGMMERRERAAAYLENGEFLLTSVLEVQRQRIVLDDGPDHEQNSRLGESARVTVVGQLDLVKIQFVAERPRRIDFSGRPAFVALLPECLLRMQRRDCYRLLSSARRPPQCEIPISPRQRVTVDLHDISCTGVSVLGCPPNLSLDTSREYHGCRIELGDLGSVVVSLRFVNGFDITTRSGHRLRRAGCRFTCMSEGAEKTIQRYILREQRERQARRRGLR